MIHPVIAPNPRLCRGLGLPKVNGSSEQVKFDAELTSPDPLYFGPVGYSHSGRMRPTWTAIGPNLGPNPSPNLDPNLGPNPSHNLGHDLVRGSR